MINSEPPGYPLYFISMKRLYNTNGLIAVITGSNAFQTDRLSDESVVRKGVNWLDNFVLYSFRRMNFLFLTIVIQSLRDTFGSFVVDQAQLLFSKRTSWSADRLFRGTYSYGAVGNVIMVMNNG